MAIKQLQQFIIIIILMSWKNQSKSVSYFFVD